MTQNYVNAFLGAVLVLAALLGLDTAVLAWTTGIVGALIVIVGLWGAGALSSKETEVRHA